MLINREKHKDHLVEQEGMASLNAEDQRDDVTAGKLNKAGLAELNTDLMRDTSSRMNSVRSSQLPRRRSIAEFLEDCPICLDEMTRADANHVLLCERRCGFNMCKNCIDSLITSSKDDFQMASDGNMHVKVYINCPNCRSDLSQSLRQTLLLRKVDEITCLTIPKSEWTSSQLRLKNALPTDEVQKAIRLARIMEAEYHGKVVDFDEEEHSLALLDVDGDDTESSSQSENEIEQWGVEVDFTHGVNGAFVTPRAPEPVARVEEVTRIDPTLFAGLDSFLSDDERKEVTRLMTGGDPLELVDAAEILYDALQRISNPNPTTIPPIRNRRSNMAPSGINKNTRSIKRRSSIYDLIEDSQHGEGEGEGEERVAEQANFQDLRTRNARQELRSRARQQLRSRVVQHRQHERELRSLANFQRRFPIPVRMPKAVKLDLSLPFDMELLDHTWGGTVMDAYSKISIGFRNQVTQRRPNNINVGNSLGTEKSLVNSASLACAAGLCMTNDQFDANDIFIALPGQPRALISDTGHIGKLGAVRGDVLTHVDGESVAGKKASEVMGIIKAKPVSEFIMLTLNAEFSVASALKRRAAVIAEVEVMEPGL